MAINNLRVSMQEDGGGAAFRPRIRSSDTAPAAPQLSPLAQQLLAGWQGLGTEVGVGSSGTANAEIGGRKLADVAEDFAKRLQEKGVTDISQASFTPGEMAAWTPEGKGNVSLMATQDGRLIPVWGSSSDAGKARQIALAVGASFLAPGLASALGGGLAGSAGAGAILGGGTAAITGGDVLRGAVLGGLGGAGMYGVNQLIAVPSAGGGIGGAGGAEFADMAAGLTPEFGTTAAYNAAIAPAAAAAIPAAAAAAPAAQLTPAALEAAIGTPGYGYNAAAAASGITPSAGFAGMSAAEFGMSGAQTAAYDAAIPAAVDYSLASAPAASSGFTPPLASTGPIGAIDYSLATQPVYGTGAGLGLGTAPLVGTGAGLALAAGASPALGAPSSFVNALTTPAAMEATAAGTAVGAGAGTAVPSAERRIGAAGADV